MTPLVFVISGLIFAATAATYAEATAMYPEAGGSSSFARHAFNEFWSFFAAWGQMLNYIITVSISAFFVPHYLAVFWEPLRHSPGDIIAGILIVVILGAVNIVGVKEAAGLNIFLALADFATQVLLVIVGAVLVFSPHTLINNIDFGRYPTFGNFLVAIPVGMVAYTGIETVSNLAEEARDYGRTIPRAIGGVVVAVAVIYAFLPAVALSAMPVVNGKTELATTYAGDPILGVVKNIDLGFLQQPAQVYVGVLAATILFIATNAGLIGVSRLTYSMGQHRQLPERLRQLHPKFRTPYIAIIVFGAIAALTIVPGKADLPRHRVRVRRDALVHDRAHLGDRAADQGARPRAALPDAGRGDDPRRTRCRSSRWRGGVGTGIAWVVVTVLNVSTLIAGDGVARDRASRTYVVYRRNQGLSLTHDDEDRRPEAGGRARGRVRVGAGGVRERPVLGAGRGDRGEARRAAAARNPHPRHDQRAGERADRRVAAGARAAGAVDDRLGSRARPAAGDRPLGEGARGRGGPADRGGGARDQGRRDRDDAAATHPGRLAARADDRVGARGPPLPGHRGVAAGDPAPGRSLSDARTGLTVTASNRRHRDGRTPTRSRAATPRACSSSGRLTPRCPTGGRSAGASTRGRDALRAYYLGLFDNVAALHEDLSVVSSEGDVVVVTCHTRAQLAGEADAEVTFDYAMRITLSDGLIASLEIFEDTQAVAAAEQFRAAVSARPRIALWSGFTSTRRGSSAR